MKKALYLFVFLFVLISCSKKSSDDSPGPIQMDPPEFSDNAYLFIFNALAQNHNVDLVINSDQFLKEDLEKGDRSDYFNLKEGINEVVIKHSDSEETLLRVEVTLERGHFYSGIFYKNTSSGYELIISKDYDEKIRESQIGSPGPKFIVSTTSVNVASNLESNAINIFNALGQKVSPNTFSTFQAVYWAQSLGYGQIERREPAWAGNTANAIFITDQRIYLSSLDTEEKIGTFLFDNTFNDGNELIHVPGIPLILTTLMENGPSGGPYALRAFHSFHFLLNKPNLIVLYDDESRPNGVNGKLLMLNNIAITQ